MVVALKNFFRINKEIIQRVLFTLLFLMIYRFGALITIPGIELNNNIQAQDNQFLSLLSIVGGGVLSKLSFFALGVSPFITASIIVQLLSTGLVPKLFEWTKQGRKGQVKLNYLTKIITVPFGYLQAIAIISNLNASQLISVKWNTAVDLQVFYYFLCPLALLSGTMMALLIADMISKKGIGQGTSVLIFTSILISTVYNFQNIGKSLFFDIFPTDSVNNSNYNLSVLTFFIHIIRAIFYVFLLFLLFRLIIFFNNSERRLPIQQTGAGLRLKNNDQTYLPIKINPSGVIPVIFSFTLFSFFTSLGDIIKNTYEFQGKPLPESSDNYIKFVNYYFNLTEWGGIGVYAALIFLFTAMYSHIAINSQNIAENFQKNGTYILGVPTGEKTRSYLVYMINRLVFFGGLYLAFLSIFFTILGKVFLYDASQSKNFFTVISGNSLLILIVIGENILRQMRDFKTQSYYLHTWTKKKDVFLW